MGMVVLAFEMLSSGSARASVFTVPDDQPSIQAAIDLGADTIYVREGDYDEVPQAPRGVTIIGLGRPRLGGLVISNPNGALSKVWKVDSVDFVDLVSIVTPNFRNRLLDISFERCRLLGGIQHPEATSSDPYDILNFRLANCRVVGPIYGRSASLVMHADTVEAGMSWGVAEHTSVDSCWFRSGGRYALELWSDIGYGWIEHNVFEDAQNGLSLSNCEEVTVRGNQVRRMSEVGMAIRGKRSLIADNVVEDCYLGVYSTGEDVTLIDNVCVRSPWRGMFFLFPITLRAERNIIGDCGAEAMWIQFPTLAALSLKQNTLYRAAGSGLVIADGTDLSLELTENIVFGSGEFGLDALASGLSSTLSCNNWFANALGPVRGIAQSAQDVSVDPGFCDVATGDVRLFSDSPLIGRTDCGQVGARGVGCSPPTLSAVRTVSVRAGIGIDWEFEAASTVQSWIERADQPVGTWDSLGSGTTRARNSFELLDAAVAPDRSYYYRVAWRDRGSVIHGSPVLGAWNDAGRLSSVSPNPAFGEVSVDWVLARPGATDIRVYDLAGREVAVVARGAFDVGRHQARWDGRWDGRGIAPAGMYIVRISSGERTTSHRVLLLR